jgi:hypothetical protein
MDWRDPYFNISGDVDDSAFASHTVCRELNQLLLRHPGGELLPLFGLLFWQREANQVVCEDKCEGVQGQTFQSLAPNQLVCFCDETQKRHLR